MVSIIVPVYNTEKYLHKCLNSIQFQTYTDWECIVVNDGSTDSSLNICEYFIQNDNRFHLINQQNKGLSEARNVGLKYARGEALMFVDSDDWIEPDTIEDLIYILNDSKADIACGSHTRLDKHVKSRESLEKVSIYTSYDRLIQLFSAEGDLHSDIVAAWGKIYRREVFNNIQFPSNRCYEDEAIIHKILLTIGSIATTNNAYYHYIDRPGSIVNTYSTKHIFDKSQAFLDRAVGLANISPELSKKASLLFYNYTTSNIIEMQQRNLFKQEDIFVKNYINWLLVNRKIYYKYLPWHQKIIIGLLKIDYFPLTEILASHRFSFKYLLYSLKM